MVAHSLAAASGYGRSCRYCAKRRKTRIYVAARTGQFATLDGLDPGSVRDPLRGGVFELAIRCGVDYPLAPPVIKFVTRIYHPNVHFRTGDICLDILKKEWSPAWGLQAACRAVLALLSDPDADSPLNCDAGNMLRAGDILAYNGTAAMYTVENAHFLSWPPHCFLGRMTKTCLRLIPDNVTST